MSVSICPCRINRMWQQILPFIPLQVGLFGQPSNIYLTVTSFIFNGACLLIKFLHPGRKFMHLYFFMPGGRNTTSKPSTHQGKTILASRATDRSRASGSVVCVCVCRSLQSQLLKPDNVIYLYVEAEYTL